LNALFKNALKAALLEASNERYSEARKILEALLVDVQNHRHATQMLDWLRISTATWSHGNSSKRNDQAGI